jgi:hypothetical protein
MEKNLLIWIKRDKNSEKYLLTFFNFTVIETVKGHFIVHVTFSGILKIRKGYP